MGPRRWRLVVLLLLPACKNEPSLRCAQGGDCLADAHVDVADGGIDATLDAGADASSPGPCLDVATARWPWNGYATGSVWATAVVAPLRPTFKWNAVCDVDNYELEVDDSCDTTGFRSCTFPSPEVSLVVDATSATVPGNLPVSTTAPVGRRYTWRVRGCTATGCGAWSMARYLDVGRLPNDMNGDGYGDVLVGAINNDTAGADNGSAYVYYGAAGPTLNAGADVTFTGLAPSDGLGESVSWAGDVNGDGFSDVLVGAPYGGPNNGGEAYLFLGGATPDVVPDAVVSSENSQEKLGTRVSGLGDIDGDGFADYAVSDPLWDDLSMPGGPFDNRGRTYVYLGGAPLPAVPGLTLTGESTGDALGSCIGTAGDMNGDGFADFVVGAATADAGGTNNGRAYVYFGAESAPGTFVLTMDGDADGVMLGFSLGLAGDVNGDGYADLAMAAPLAESTGRVYLFFGGSTPDLEIDATLAGGSSGDYFGSSIASAGDVNGDGYSDLVVGASYDDGGSMMAEDDRGMVSIYRGGAGAFDVVPDTSIFGQSAGDNLGVSVAPCGDLNGDGFSDYCAGARLDDAGVAPGDDRGRAYAFFGSSTGGDATADGTLTGASPTDWFGGSVGSASF